MGPLGRALFLSVAIHFSLAVVLDLLGLGERQFRWVERPAPLAARLMAPTPSKYDERPSELIPNAGQTRRQVCKDCRRLPAPTPPSAMAVVREPTGLPVASASNEAPTRTDVDKDGVIVQEISVDDLPNRSVKLIPGKQWHYSLELDVRPFAKDDLQVEHYRPVFSVAPVSVPVVVYINESGVVIDVDVLAGEADLALLIREALFAVRFSPGELAGEAVPSILVLEFLF